jgi:hypothetical protein
MSSNVAIELVESPSSTRLKFLPVQPEHLDGDFPARLLVPASRRRGGVLARVDSTVVAELQVPGGVVTARVEEEPKIPVAVHPLSRRDPRPLRQR